MRRLLILLALLALPSLASAREGWRGWCEDGNQSVVTSGISSTTKVQRSFPQCQVLVLVHGGGVATIYADNNGTPLANPFQANLDGSWIAYANDGRYDFQVTQGSGLSFTYLDVLLCDPFVAGAVCSGAASGAHNLLSTTHLDTIPFSPPVRGDIITAQNLTSPSAVTPAWARLPLGTSGQVLLSNGIDALWGSLTAGSGITVTNNSGSLTIATSGGGGGCTLPGHDTGILSEHPVGTCFNSVNATWDDTNHNLQFGDALDGNTVGSHDTIILGPGNNLTGARFAQAFGGANDIHSPTGVALDDEPTIVVGGGNSVGDVAHANSGGKDNTVVGNQSAVYNASWVQIVGVAGIGIDGGAGTETFGFSIGGANEANCVQGPVCSSAGAGTVTSFGLMGDNNLINWHGSGNVSGAYAGGNNNRFDTTIGNISGSVDTMWGFDNEIDGAVGNDVQIFGASNTSHNSGTATCLGASDAAIGGALNVVTGSGNFMVFGGGNVVTSHTCVGVFGLNITATANNTAYYGMSPTAGLVITASNGLGTGFDNVQRSPLTFTHLPACAAGTEGSFAAITDSTTATPGATITGSGSNHVLGYCNSTNWVVASGSASDFPDVKLIPAANCPNAVAGSGWSYASSTWTAACRAGTNNLGGVLQLIPATGGAAQFRFEIPKDWDSASQPFIRIEYASGANTSGTVIWTVASACTKADGSITDDPAFNAESSFATQTMAAANRAWSQTGQFTAITSGNNCVGGGGVIIKLTLSGTAASAINAYQAVVTAQRLPVVQAN